MEKTTRLLLVLILAVAAFAAYQLVVTTTETAGAREPETAITGSVGSVASGNLPSPRVCRRSEVKEPHLR